MPTLTINFFLIIIWWYIVKMLPTNRPVQVYCTIIVLQFILIVGLRDLSIGGSGMLSDVDLYRSHYNNVKGVDFKEIFSYNDSKAGLFYLILSLFSSLGVSFELFVIIYCAFIFGVFGRYVSKYSESPVISFIIFAGHAGFIFSYYLFRQCIACAFVLLAFDFFVRKRRIPCAVLILAAVMIHYSALVVVPFFLLANWNVSKFTYLASVAIVAIVSYFRNSFALIVTLLFSDNYLGEYDSSNSIGGTAIFCLVLLLFFVFVFNKKTLSKNQDKLPQFYLYGLLFASVIQVCSSYAYTFSRLNLFYFQCIIAIAVPYMFSSKNLQIVIKDRALSQVISFIGYVTIVILMYILYTGAIIEEGLDVYLLS